MWAMSVPGNAESNSRSQRALDMLPFMQCLASLNASVPFCGQVDASDKINCGVISSNPNSSPPRALTNASAFALFANDAKVGPISPGSGCHATYQALRASMNVAAEFDGCVQSMSAESCTKRCCRICWCSGSKIYPKKSRVEPNFSGRVRPSMYASPRGPGNPVMNMPHTALVSSGLMSAAVCGGNC